MNLLVTGASGFIAKSFLYEYYKQYNIICIGRSNAISNIPVNGNVIPYITTDYSIDSLSEIINKYRINSVLHSAAIRPLKLYSEKFSDYQDNISISQNIFESCRQTGVLNITFLSSIAVYGQYAEQPWKEFQQAKPVSFYGLTKRIVEEMAQYYNNNFSMNIKSLRLSQVFGYGERESYCLPIFINKALRKETLIIFGDGSEERDFIYIQDVLNAINKALKNKELKGIFNIGSNQTVSIIKLATLINSIFDNENNLVLDNSRLMMTGKCLMDCSLANTILRWQPELALNDSLLLYKEKIFQGNIS